MRKWIFIVTPVVLALAAAGLWLGTGSGTAAGRAGESYEFAAVSRGDIESVVSASGTLAAVSTVSILSQMSGRAEKVNVDYNDHVSRGQVLVELNTDTLRLEEIQARAEVRKAVAWRDRHGVPMWCGEFGTARWARGALQWTKDWIEALEEERIGWAFYEYRGWEPMDLEMDPERREPTLRRETPFTRLYREWFSR